MIAYLTDCSAARLQGFAVCVIGSGAAGLSLTVTLARAGIRVLLVDSGDWKESADLADAYVGRAQAPHPATTEYRRQRFGGTTHLWGGRCVPLDPADFAARAHVPHSGWPIGEHELQPYLQEAMNCCDAGAADFTVGSLAGPPAPMFAGLPELAPALAERIERYSLPTDFAAKYRDELTRSPNVLVALRARCVGLGVLRGGQRVVSAELSDGDQRVRVEAATFALCGGGIEVPRLLMCTRTEVPEWQRFDGSLGRYYGCHYDLIFGAMSFTGALPRFDFERTKDGIYARRKLQFSGAFQQQHRLLNSMFRLHFPPYSDPAHGSGVLSTIYLAKSVLAAEHQSIMDHGAGGKPQRQTLAHARNVATDFGSVLRFGHAWLFHRKLATRKLPYTLIPNRNGSYPLEFNSEQVPDAANRITLQPERDSAGMPRVSVAWRLTETDVASGVDSFVQLQGLLSQSPNCRLAFDRGELRERVQAALPVGGHHIGATRMGRSAEHSVVDRNCRVHGVDNLFVASASVFPTSSHANPTLTIVALALRLAAHLQGDPCFSRPPERHPA